MNALAERVTYFIDSQGIKRSAVPKRGGPSRPTLYRIENDPEYRPEDFTVDRLADAIGASRTWLKTGDGPMFPSPLEAYARSIPDPARTAETYEPYRGPEAQSLLDAALLQRAIQEALAVAPGELPERLAQAIADAYHTALRTRRLDKVGELVRTFLS